MIDRIKNILLSPKTEWPRIDAEPMTEKGIFMGWVVPLAAIGPVCGLIGQQAFGGASVMGISWKPSIGFSVTTAVVSYLMALLGTYVVAKIIDALAPTFDGVKNPVAALKVVAFSWTAAWVAGVFQLVPQLAFLGLLGLYSLYLLYLGLPVLMKSPQEKAIGYTVVACLCAVVMFFIIGIVTGAVVSALVPSSSMGTLTVPTYQ